MGGLVWEVYKEPYRPSTLRRFTQEPGLQPGWAFNVCGGDQIPSRAVPPYLERSCHHHA